LAETLPATKVGQEVSYGQKTVYYQALLGWRQCRKYPVRICGCLSTVLAEVFFNFFSASNKVVWYYLSRTEYVS
jgi:hypothetical protein